MTALAATIYTTGASHSPHPQYRESARSLGCVPEIGPYRNRMLSQDVRRTRFGRFVRRALEDANLRGMTIRQIEASTGVSSTTFYRWRDGDWTRDPRPSQVKRFCDGLDIPYQAAFRTLGWSGDDRQDTAPEPLVEPDLRLIQRRLLDPGVPEEQKQAIRQMLRLIAGQPRQSRRVAGD